MIALMLKNVGGYFSEAQYLTTKLYRFAIIMLPLNFSRALWSHYFFWVLIKIGLDTWGH